jgi:hypothetical protein
MPIAVGHARSVEVRGLFKSPAESAHRVRPGNAQNAKGPVTTIRIAGPAAPPADGIATGAAPRVSGRAIHARVRYSVRAAVAERGRFGYAP